MQPDRHTLSRIDNLQTPRHLFVLPSWVQSAELDRLLEQDCLTCEHLQRDRKGDVLVAMGIELTGKGKRLIQPADNWQNLALKGSLAGASLTAMSLLILYLG